MYTINENYLNLQGSYLFTTIARKVEEYKEKNPSASIIRLGIGDVTKPLAPAIIKALHSAVDEMGCETGFHGYGPEQGYEFLRKTIVLNDYKARNCEIYPDEVFISDGAKCDVGNIQEIFGQNNIVGICDPVYPVYVDTNVMAGRSGKYNANQGGFENIVYMPCTEYNGFVPAFPKERVDIIYLCFPNNPTGMTITKQALQDWVNYANKTGALIIYDAAYEAYICEEDVPHSIYECEGARTCAIEIHSFSKNAGFTGLRLGYSVIPKDLVVDGVSVHSLWSRRHGTKYNGAPYIVQKAGEAVYSKEGKEQLSVQVGYYMENARIIREGLKEAGYTAYGGVNAPYIWLKVPKGMTSWDFFDRLLEEAHVVGTPGSGFGSNGEGFLRLTAFGTKENSYEALKRIKLIL